jgi:uncharacterized protein YbjT (DUF2867 family)
MKNYLIFGASGRVGTEVVKLLRKIPNINIRIATSQVMTAQKNGNIEKIFLNLVTGEGLKEALRGIDRVFLLLPTGYAGDAQYAMLSGVLTEVKQAQVEKIVLMSAYGANTVDTTPLARIEKELISSDLAYNIIRPNWFMQNFDSFWADMIRQQRKILLPAGDAKVSFIDVRDIAAVAVELLTTDKFINQAFDLTGPQAINFYDVAKLISAAIQQTVTFEDSDPQVLKKNMLANGASESYAEFLLFIFSILKAGYNAEVTTDVQNILSRPAINFEKYVIDYKQAWLK